MNSLARINFEKKLYLHNLGVPYLNNWQSGERYPDNNIQHSPGNDEGQPI